MLRMYAERLPFWPQYGPKHAVYVNITDNCNGTSAAGMVHLAFFADPVIDSATVN
jgi:hypothetical protein